MARKAGYDNCDIERQLQRSAILIDVQQQGPGTSLCYILG
jgi:hypothetical protein